jgi:hypothetical protein
MKGCAYFHVNETASFGRCKIVYGLDFTLYLVFSLIRLLIRYQKLLIWLPFSKDTLSEQFPPTQLKIDHRINVG